MIKYWSFMHKTPQTSKFYMMVWTISIATLSGCGPTIQGEYRFDGFSKRQLAVSGLVVAGVVSTLEQQTVIRRSSWAEWLTASFREEHMFPVQSSVYLNSALGKEAYQSMLNYYRIHGDVNASDVAMIRERLPEIRYVAFARLLHNEVVQRRDEKVEQVEEDEDNHEDGKKHSSSHGWSHTHQRGHRHEHKHDGASGLYWHNHSHSEDHDHHYRDSVKKPAEPIKIHTYYRTIREIAVSLLIYDLHISAPAWSGVVEKSGGNSNQYTEVILPRGYTNDDDWTPLQLFGDVFLGVVNDAADGAFVVGDQEEGQTGVKPEQYQYPGEVPLDKVLSRAFNDFAEALPRR